MVFKIICAYYTTLSAPARGKKSGLHTEGGTGVTHTFLGLLKSKFSLGGLTEIGSRLRHTIYPTFLSISGGNI
jgi:hypothetical protein